MTGRRLSEWSGSGTDTCEAVPVGEGAYWVDFSIGERRVETITVGLHPEKGWALIVHSRIHEEGAEVGTRVMQTAPSPTRQVAR